MIFFDNCAWKFADKPPGNRSRSSHWAKQAQGNLIAALFLPCMPKLPGAEADMPKMYRHGGLSLFYPWCALAHLRPQKQKFIRAAILFLLGARSFQREGFRAGKAYICSHTAAWKKLKRSRRGKQPLKTILCWAPGSLWAENRPAAQENPMAGAYAHARLATMRGGSPDGPAQAA